MNVSYPSTAAVVMNPIGSGSTIIGTTTTGTTPFSGSYLPSGVVYGKPSDSYISNCQQVRDILHSLNGFYEMLHNGTEEENLLLLETISKRLSRAKSIVNDSIDIIEKGKSINLK